MIHGSQGNGNRAKGLTAQLHWGPRWETTAWDQPRAKEASTAHGNMKIGRTARSKSDATGPAQTEAEPTGTAPRSTRWGKGGPGTRG